MIGIDIVKIDRIKGVFLRNRDAFLKKILSEVEIEEISDIHSDDAKIKFLSKRFAVKEAYIKAIGGYTKGLLMSRITVMHNTVGQPFIRIDDEILRNFSVSISDEEDYAVAVVLRM